VVDALFLEGVQSYVTQEREKLVDRLEHLRVKGKEIVEKLSMQEVENLAGKNPQAILTEVQEKFTRAQQGDSDVKAVLTEAVLDAARARHEAARAKEAEDAAIGPKVLGFVQTSSEVIGRLNPATPGALALNLAIQAMSPEGRRDLRALIGEVGNETADTAAQDDEGGLLEGLIRGGLES
jgi:hypothetical protein